MLKPDKSPVIKTLYKEGQSKRHIARLLKINVKTVRKALAKNEGEGSNIRRDKIIVDEELLRKEYRYCNGYLERVHERLTEEYGIKIAYSTLTLRARELGLGKKITSRSEHVPDVPGQEQQYDTSPFSLHINEKKTKVICSGLYMRYSKMRYIKFYRSDNRFNMKCFLDEALRYWDYSAKICIIDNTCLAVWYGTGSGAVFHPEMENFAKNYGFEFKAHALFHSNRKAGVEKNFHTVITNFFSGRTFNSLEDLNKQAFAWATERFAKRPQSKTGLIPIDTFEIEKAYLNKLPVYIPEPYYPPQIRNVTAYGYCAFEANYYWVPEYYGESREKILKVSIIRYAGRIVLYFRTLELARYNLPPENVKNEKFAPEGVVLKYQPKHRKLTCHDEEKLLREIGSDVNAYIDFIKSKECRLRKKYHFLRRLYALSGKMTTELLLNAVKRALKYKVYDIDTISRIAAQSLKRTGEMYDFVEPEFNEGYKKRESYIQGQFCTEPDIDYLDSHLITENIE